MSSEIIVTAAPKGNYFEGIISGTPKPGTIVQIQAGTALVGGRPTFEVYNRAADGDMPLGPLFVLNLDWMQGKAETAAFVTGGRCQVYAPLPADQLRLLAANIAGTGSGDEWAIGREGMVDDGTGKIVRLTGTPATRPFIAMESVLDVTADTLVQFMYSGY